MMARGDMDASPDAISSCAPYGRTPCTKQEVISISDAVLRGLILYFSESSLAIGPTVRMAMVLLAVQMLATAVKNDIEASAPLLPDT